MKKAIIIGMCLMLVTVGILSGCFEPERIDMEKVGVVSSYTMGGGQTTYMFNDTSKLTVEGSYSVETNRLVRIRYIHVGKQNEFVDIEYLDGDIE